MLRHELASLIETPPDLVVTANRRLARVISRAHAEHQIAAGRTAWRPLEVRTLPVWLRQLFSQLCDRRADIQALTLLSADQARAVWQGVVDRQLDRSDVGVAGQEALIDEVANAFGLLCDWQVSDDELKRQAHDDDSAFFVACLNDLRQLLEREGWLIEPQLTDVLLAHHADLQSLLPAAVVFAGFGELNPAQHAFMRQIQRDGVELIVQSAASHAPAHHVACDSNDDELILAGAWVRRELELQPTARLAVVVPGLAGQSARARRLLLEGLNPAGQCRREVESERGDRLVEVSFAQALADYPAIANAMECIGYLLGPVRFQSLSRLLRAAEFHAAEDEHALALELRLRDLPDRLWTPDRLVAFCTGAGVEIPVWLKVLSESAPRREQQSPSDWAALFADVLKQSGWLTTVDVNSEVFQLRNAYFEVLNRLSSLDALHRVCSGAFALSTLRNMLANTVYQPEGQDASVLLCGPLEMNGLAFDRIWVAGLDASHWPPAAQPNSLLPRRLQAAKGMPDATPERSQAFWRRQLHELSCSAVHWVASFATQDGDSTLFASPMLSELGEPGTAMSAAATLGVNALVGQVSVVSKPEALGRFSPQRAVRGGYAVLEWQARYPFIAMLTGRWACRVLREPAVGIDPSMRGQFVHQALEQFYRGLSSRREIESLPASDLADAAQQAVARTMRGQFAVSDDLLTQLLRMEEQRCVELLLDFVRLDLTRADFKVVATEQPRTLELGGLRLELRVDRVDQVGDHALIIDYKTGANIIGVRVSTLYEQHLQLALYAITEQEPLAGLALAGLSAGNIGFVASVVDGLDVGLSGRKIERTTDLDNWRERWWHETERLAHDFVQGVVSLNPQMPADQQQPYALLTRIAGAQRDG
ncbi:MAG: PD-(D/E)XK nuclease family protein [Pseudomonadota bacterium]